MSYLKRIIIISLPCLLLACSSVPEPQATPAKVSAAETATRDKTQQQEKQKQAALARLNKAAAVDDKSGAPLAVQSLMQRAQQQKTAEQYSMAINTLNRAVRMAPRYPDTYFQLGQVYLLQGQPALATSFAKKAISLGAQGPLKLQAEQLIKQALP